MAFVVLRPTEPGSVGKGFPISSKLALRFKAIKEGKAIPTPYEKEKADQISKIYLSKSSVYPQEVKRDNSYRLPYKEAS